MMSVSPRQDGCDGAAQARAKMGSGCSGGRHEGLATGLSPIRACAQCSVLVVGVAADLRETASLPRSRLGRSPRDLVPRARPGDEDGGGGALCEGDRA